MFLYEALGMFMAALSLSLSPFSFGIFSDRLNVRRSRRCRIKEGSTLPSAYMGLGYMFFFCYKGLFWMAPNRLLYNKIGRIYGFLWSFCLYGFFMDDKTVNHISGTQCIEMHL